MIQILSLLALGEITSNKEGGGRVGGWEGGAKRGRKVERERGVKRERDKGGVEKN